MKKRNNYFKEKIAEELVDMSFDDYTDLFQDGLSDDDISRGLGVDVEYVKNIRNDYLSDY